MEIAIAQGPLEIELTITYGIDKDGKVTLDWDASAVVPKGMTTPRIDEYMAAQIMDAAKAAMTVKDRLNWSVRPEEPPEPGEPADNPADALP